MFGKCRWLVAAILMLMLLPFPALANNGEPSIELRYDLAGGYDPGMDRSLYANGIFYDEDDGLQDDQFDYVFPAAPPLRDGFLFAGWTMEWDEITLAGSKGFYTEEIFWPGDMVSSEDLSYISEIWYLTALWEANTDLDTFLFLNGERLYSDIAPVIVNGRTMVPIRVISEAFGCEVEYYPTDPQYGNRPWVSIDGDGLHIELIIGDDTALVNLVDYPLDVPSQVVYGRTMVPLRFIGEAFGAGIEWQPSLTTMEANVVDIVY